MRILVISDIHGNLTALEAVLAEAGEVDTVWCLGDVVGYGPDPNQSIARLQELPNFICLLGNHDAAAIGQIPIHGFNPEARAAIVWTQSVLEPESATFLKSLTQTASIDKVTLAHGSPRNPILEYLLDTRTATENFEFFNTDFCFVGHSHLPLAFSLTDGQYLSQLSVPPVNQPIPLLPRIIVNPGSVGQPRDRDPRASFAIFDTENDTWQNQRVEYDIAAVQERMRAAELPDRHVTRLTGGW